MIEGQKRGLAETESADAEVTPKAKRRSFSASYKKKILAEVEAAAGSGNIGEILRREGIYSSTLTSWRKERDAAVDGAFSRKRGPEPKRNPVWPENGSCLKLRTVLSQMAGGETDRYVTSPQRLPGSLRSFGTSNDQNIHAARQ